MKWALAVLVIGIVAACSSLPDAGSGVVALEVRTPDTVGGVGCPTATSCILPHGDTLRLHARALNLNGDSIAAAILWITPDTALIGLDALAGVITAVSDTGGTARVQASVGNLRSDIIQVTLQRDTTTTSSLRGRR